MTKPRVTLVLCLILTVLIAAAWLITRQAATVPDLRQLNNASQLELKFRGVKVKLAKQSNLWAVKEYDGKSTLDSRANQSLVNHLLDLLKTLDLKSAERVATDDPASYTSSSELAISTAGQSIVFGNPDISGRQIYLYFPEQHFLTLTRTAVPMLMSPHTPLDLRNRHVTTFEVDDLEDLTTSPECRAYALVRDGDRWMWKSAAKVVSGAIDEWLKAILEVKYDSIDETKPKPGDLACKIELQGRKGRAETLTLTRDASGRLWATNSTLPAAYQVSEDLLKMVKTGTVPKAAAGF